MASRGNDRSATEVRGSMKRPIANREQPDKNSKNNATIPEEKSDSESSEDAFDFIKM
jgi:hypothetical protein